MGLPLLLIIDDLFGGSLRDRKNFCKAFGIVDITGDEPTPVAISDPVAEAIFESSQVRHEHGVLNDSAKALEILKSRWDRNGGRRWALVLLDLRFVSGKFDEDGEPEGSPGDDLFGLIMLEVIHKRYPDLPVVVISSKERSEVIEDCRRRGAEDFIQRHVYGAALSSSKDLLKQKILEHGLIEDNRHLDDEKYRIAGSSINLLLTLRSARRAATGKGNLLLLGETGTGKELLARYIHDMSPRANGPYQVYDPSGRAETLQEDELFGHVKGAFTGADLDRPGLLEMTRGGTLFIDEIGEVPESLQTKMLRPLESWVVRRQGGKKDIALELQVILATNKNLEVYVREKKFKFDLLNRIKAYPIVIPPLRERKEDIPCVVEQLLEVICRQHNARWPRIVQKDTLDLLAAHNWNDNIRGLRNVLQRAVLNHKDSELILPRDIQFDPVEFPEFQQCADVTFSTVSPLNQLLESISNFEFPSDYEEIHGKFPVIQKAVGKLMMNYLSAAIEVTRRRKPGSTTVLEANMTGAVSCMVGVQLKTPTAADFVKKLLQQDLRLLESLPESFPELNKVYQEAVRLRPKRPSK